MSSERDSLLDSIRENPDDDAPRLVFADWLDEHDEPDFAAFIRVEIERDRLPRSDPRWQSLNEQSRALGKKAPADFRAAGVLCLTRRGFPYNVQTSLVQLRDGIDRLGPYTPRLKLCSVAIPRPSRRPRRCTHAADRTLSGRRFGNSLRRLGSGAGNPWRCKACG